MKSGRSICFMVLVNLPVPLAGQEIDDLRAEAGAKAIAWYKRDLSQADAFFRAGKFAEAEVAYAKIVARVPSDSWSLSSLGCLALLSNRLADAQKNLEHALQIEPKDEFTKLLLAEAFYRQDKFERAASLLRAAGRTTLAKNLESFRGLTPYEVRARAKSTVLKFLVTEPLPLVKVKVNGKEATFVIDTGAPQVVLDPDFARQVQAREFGSVGKGTFAGGKSATVQGGRIDSLTLGDVEIRNVPVLLLNTHQFAPGFGGKQVDGILGTVFFYHFLTTLDYPRGELVLRQKTEKGLKGLDKAAVVIPFWMAGDHYMVAWGKIESLPVLFFVDTGMAGGGLSCTESVLKEAGIKLAEDQASESMGGGGKHKVVPFTVKNLSLGEATAKNVRGVFNGPFLEENAFGFRIGGFIGHGFFRPYAVTFDFTGMRLHLKK
jgi:predicted aspartyl protease